MKAIRILTASAGVMFAASVCAHAQAPFTNGLVAYYPFNWNANDESGFSRNMIIYGDTTLTYDRFGVMGRAYVFDGADDWLRASAPINDVTNNFTMTIWFKASEEHRQGEMGPCIIFPAHGAGTWGDASVGAGISAGTNEIGVWEHTHDFNPKVIQLAGNFPDWTMVALVYSNRIPFLYTNGVLAVVGNQSSRSPVRPSNGQALTSQLYGRIEGGIGGVHQVGGGASFFKGRLDDIRIYNRVLSSGELTQLHAYDIGPCMPYKATATAQLVNGFVVGATITNGGCGYTNAPVVLVQGGGGSGATATATVTNGVVVAINITSAGCCYTNIPQIVIASPPFAPTLSIMSPSRHAKATAELVNGFVVGASIIDGGYGYTSNPRVLIQGAGGSGATATAVISNNVVVAINITSAGCCYTNAPEIIIDSPASKVRVTQNVVLGGTYVLESSSSLTNWAEVGPPFTATSESVTDEFDVDVTGRFFRIRQVP